MNPSWGPELPPVEVGSGGEEEVKVVARRVGLKRRDVALTERSEASRGIHNHTFRCQMSP